MSYLQDAYEAERFEVQGGLRCRGVHCRGWICSDLDVWFRCPCGQGDPNRHPEADYDYEEVAVVDAFHVVAGKHVVGFPTFKAASKAAKAHAVRFGEKVEVRRGAPPAPVEEEEEDDFDLDAADAETAARGWRI